LQRDVCAGRPRSWSGRLQAIIDEADKSGFAWKPRHRALVQAIVERGLLNDLENVETAPDGRSAARRLSELEEHASRYHVTTYAARIEEMKRKNHFDQAESDLEEGKIADSAGHFLLGAAMSLGIFE
jgi:hypothetical protein